MKHEEQENQSRVEPLMDCVERAGSTAEPSPGAVTAAERPETKCRIWATHAPFKKSGFPFFNAFGYQYREVVVIPMATWTQLCREIPGLATREFEVGTED